MVESIDLKKGERALARLDPVVESRSFRSLLRPNPVWTCNLDLLGKKGLMSIRLEIRSISEDHACSSQV